jgi:hypothetical protein
MKNIMFVAIYAGLSHYIQRTEQGYVSKTVDPVNGLVKAVITRDEAFDIVSECLADAEDLECSAEFRSTSFEMAYYDHITPEPCEDDEDDVVTQNNYVYTAQGITLLAKEDIFPNGMSFVSYFKQIIGESTWEIISSDEWYTMRLNADYVGKTQI